MKEITLTRGMVALVDDEDYERLSAYRWCALKSEHTFYAVRNVGRSEKVLMHRELLAAPRGMEVDHISGDGLDNRRCNIRIATSRQNKHNQGIRRSNKSGYKGVHLNRNGRWRARMRIPGGHLHLGYFDTAELANAAYCAAARKYQGEFARAA